MKFSFQKWNLLFKNEIFFSKWNFLSKMKSFFQKWNFLFKNEIFFSEMEFPFQKWNFLFKNEIFFSKIKSSFQKWNLLFKNEIFFSKMKFSFQKWNLLFKNEIFFSKWNLFFKNEIFFSKMKFSFQKWNFLFKNEIFFSKMKFSFQKWNFLFKNKIFFSKMKSSFQKWNFLFKNEIFFSKMKFSFQKWNFLFRNGIFFSKMKFSFQKWNFLFKNEIFFSKMKSSFQKFITNFRSLFNFKIFSEQKIFIFEHGYADGVGIGECTVSSWNLSTRNVLSINRPDVCCNLDYFVVLIVYICDGYDAFLSFSIRNSSFFDRAVEPCDDFYEFACGKWNETEPIPEDRGRWGVFDILRRKLSGTLQSRTFLNPQRSLINHELCKIFLTFFFSSVGCRTSNHCTTQRHAKNAGLLPYVSRRRWIRQTRTSREHFYLDKICLFLSFFVFFCFDQSKQDGIFGVSFNQVLSLICVA